ncbi:MAG TPA: outer membrane beta-barrel protein [Candidatus Acidoferrum sp.]|nr:outer membrane beta-barrel protein [Candidatus Acidoferrum sp.]
MFVRKMLFLGLILMCGVPKAHAQREYEITPFFGTRFGGNIDLSQQGNPNVDSLKIKSSEDFGIMGGVSFWGNFQGEFMYNRQPTSLSAHNPNDGTYTFVSNMNLDMYQFDVLYQFKSMETKFRGFTPFVVGGLGLSHFGIQPVNGQQVLPFGTRFSYNLGGGIKYFFTSHFGLRAEVRWSPSHTTQGVAEYCDPFFGCSPTTVANKAEQGQANIGLIFRFNGI